MGGVCLSVTRCVRAIVLACIHGYTLYLLKCLYVFDTHEAACAYVGSTAFSRKQLGNSTHHGSRNNAGLSRIRACFSGMRTDAVKNANKHFSENIFGRCLFISAAPCAFKASLETHVRKTLHCTSVLSFLLRRFPIENDLGILSHCQSAYTGILPKPFDAGRPREVHLCFPLFESSTTNTDVSVCILSKSRRESLNPKALACRFFRFDFSTIQTRTCLCAF